MDDAGPYAFPNEAINALRRAKYDHNAERNYELLSGALFWDDEGYFEFLRICRAKDGEVHGKRLFAYRATLILEKPYEPYQYVWDEVKERCPEWIGFRSERITPSAELQAYLSEEHW